MFLHSLVVSLCLTSYVAPRDQPKFTPIAAETIAEYQKLGAEYGLFEINGRGYVLFRPRTDYEALTEYEATLVPGFKFDSLAAGALDKLPPIAVPFGLAFCDPEMSDSEIGKLKKFKNLTVLSLWYARVTGIGLKELAGLEWLSALDLSSTKVTDNDLKSLKGLKNVRRFRFLVLLR